MAVIGISEAALDAAIQKAVEAGVFRRHGTAYDAVTDREVMRAILQAAFTASAREEGPNSNTVSSRTARPTDNCEISGFY